MSPPADWPYYAPSVDEPMTAPPPPPTGDYGNVWASPPPTPDSQVPTNPLPPSPSAGDVLKGLVESAKTALGESVMTPQERTSRGLTPAPAIPVLQGIADTADPNKQPPVDPFNPIDVALRSPLGMEAAAIPTVLTKNVPGILKAGAQQLGADVRAAAPELKAGIKAFNEDEWGAIRIPGGDESLLPATIPPATPPTPGGALDKTYTMLEEARNFKAPSPTLADRKRRAQELLTDRFAGINALSPDVERQVALLGGTGDAQAQRAADIASSVKQALGPVWRGAQDDLDAYLHLQQAIDIEAAKGAGRKIPGAIKGASDAAQGLQELEANLGPQRWSQLQQAAQAAIQESQATLYRMVDAGLVDQELADALIKQYPHYNKQNILIETADLLSNRAVGRNKISVNNANLKRLTEEGTELARTSPYASIIGSAADAEALIFRNNAARAAAQEAVRQGIGTPVSGVRKVASVPRANLGIDLSTGEMTAKVQNPDIFRRSPGDIPNTISYLENGERKLVEVPPWMAQEAEAISKYGDSALIKSVSWINSLPKAAFVTYNPAWPAANLVSDYMTAAITQGVTPLEETRGFVGAIKDLFGNDPVLQRMRREGAGQAGWFAKSPQDVAKIVKDSGNLAIENERQWQDAVKNVVKAPFDLVRTGGQVAEQATRRAVYQTNIKRGATGAEAALQSRRATIDFQRGGELTKAANAVTAFLNAGVQGTMLPFRALRDSPRSRWALGAALGANGVLYAYNRQFPEYEDVPRDVKRGSMIVMLPSTETDSYGKPKPNYIAILPKVREWGLFFGTQNYIMEQLDQKSHEGVGQFLSLLAAQTSPVSGSSIIPTVPLEEAFQQATNNDLYRGKPIVPPELASQPNSEQYDAYTSDAIRRVAQATGLSPLRLQHGIYGITGGAGQAATSVADAALQQLSPRATDFRIAQLSHELDQISVENGVPSEEVPLRRTEYLSSLSPEDRTAVLDMARLPQSRVPVVGAMTARFYNPRGGEEYRQGQEAAAAATGKSPEQTATASKAIGIVSDQLRLEQAALDDELAKHPGDPSYATKWRDAQGDQATKYQGALMALGALFPGAAQVGDKQTWNDWQHNVYTIADSQPDSRTKAQVLAAGYRAIPLENLDPLTPDFAKMQQKRDEFKAALTPADQELLGRTLKANMTPMQKKFAEAKEVLRPYWDIKDKMLASPGFKPVAAMMDKMQTLSPNSPVRKLYTATTAYQTFTKLLTQAHKQYLISHHDAYKAALEFGYGVPDITKP